MSLHTLPKSKGEDPKAFPEAAFAVVGELLLLRAPRAPEVRSSREADRIHVIVVVDIYVVSGRPPARDLFHAFDCLSILVQAHHNRRLLGRSPLLGLRLRSYGGPAGYRPRVHYSYCT